MLRKIGMNSLKELQNQKTFFILNFGCAANQAYSESIRELLNSKGMLEESIEKADIIVVNSCTVKSVTENKILAKIQKLKENGKRVIVTGCMASAQPGLLSSVVEKEDIVTLEELTNLDCKDPWYKLLPKLPLCPPNEFTHIVPISRGCLGHCTYCITKIAVGPLRSYSKNEIIASIVSGLNKGAREIFLTAQDLAVYGEDRGENELLDLLESIDKLPFNFVVRLGMMTPNWFSKISDPLLKLISSSEKFYKFLHLPLESASDRILKLMGREYDYNLFRNLVLFSKSKIPMLNLMTDLIVGFPTETEEDFNKSIAAIIELKPFKVNISKFTPRPHTLASLFPKLNSTIVDERTRIISNIARKISLEQRTSFVGKRIHVIPLKKIGANKYFGRSINYISSVIFSNEELKLGLVYIGEVKKFANGFLLCMV